VSVTATIFLWIERTNGSFGLDAFWLADVAAKVCELSSEIDHPWMSTFVDPR